MTFMPSPHAYALAKPLRHKRILAAAGGWMRRHQRLIRSLQWGVVAVYAVLLIVPNLVPLPDRTAHVWNNITVFAQFVFWGIWWPGVLLSMLVFGRLWCGVLCPEGALSEFASRHGRQRAIPRWVRWPGWPFAAFLLTTVYGQLVSVYQYPAPALLILGGSTVAAIGIGFLYGREKRVWCRYLCPVNGVFGLLSKLAPMHYAVDRKAWDACPPDSAAREAFNCAPLVPVRTMESCSACHMCGRCSDFRSAVHLEARAPNSEIVEVSERTATFWDSALIIVGLLGTATAAFQWSSSPWFVTLKQFFAGWLIEHDTIWPLETSAPWWLLTNYAGHNDVMTVLDGAVCLLYIGLMTAAITVAVSLPLALSVRLAGPLRLKGFHHLSHALIPLAACGVILGLSATTVTLMRADGFDLTWLPQIRFAAIAGSLAWSLWLAGRIAYRRSASWPRTALATAGFALAALAPITAWVFMFWIW